MKNMKRILSLLLAVVMVLSMAPTGLVTPASAVDVASGTDLAAAIESGETEITLTSDVEYEGFLAVTDGLTLDLAGHNLYVNGGLVLGDGTLEKNGGMLWIDVSNADVLTEAPSEEDLSDLWAAAEILNESGTVFDGIRLTADVEATGYVYNGDPEAETAATVAEATAWQEANLPNLFAADAFSETVKYGIVKIPADKTLDLNGYKLTVRAIKATFGDGDIVDNAGDGGRISAWYNASSGKAASLASAVALANERPGIVTSLAQTSGTPTYTSYPIPDGVALSIAGGSIVGTLKIAANAGVSLDSNINANVVEIGEGATLDLAGRNLTVTGLTNNGTIVKGSREVNNETIVGKLWAKVSTATALKAAPTAASVTNLWAADEVLLDPDTDFDGIVLGAAVSTVSANPYGTSSTAQADVTAWQQENLPNMTAATCFGSGSKYGIIKIPAGKTLDLNEKVLTLRATQPTLGEGDIDANGGSISLAYSATTSTVGAQTLASAVAIANERAGIVKTLNQTASAVQYNNFPIPAGVALSITGSASVTAGHTVTFMVANEADFTRTGTDSEKITSKAFKLANDITLTGDLDVGAADVDYNRHTVTGGTITTTGTVSGEPAGAATVASKSELDNAISNANSPITLSADIDYDDVLTIPEGTTIDLAGNNLYVTGLVNNGTLTKNGGKLWANASTGDTLDAEPSAADVSNIWAANEELLRTGTEFDGVRLTASITSYSNAVTSGAEANKASILPRMAAEGAFASSLYRAMPRIPEGKTLDLNGKTLVALAANTSFGTDTMGTGTIAANGGQIKLRIHNQGGWKFAVQTANAHPGIVSEIRHNNGSGTISTLGTSDPAYPVPAGVAVATAGCKLTAVVFEVASEADFTRTGTSSENITVVGFKLADDITLSEDVDIGSKNMDYAYHTVTGGSIITTGTQSHQAVGAMDVATKAELAEAAEAHASPITLTANINYDDVLTIQEGVTVNLNGKNLYVTGLVNNGTLTKNGGTLWANVSANTQLTAAPTTANVSNYWAAQEEILDPATEFDGIRLTAILSSATSAAGSLTNTQNYVPRLYATGSYKVSTANSALYFLGQIPAGKTLNLNGKAIMFCATTDSMGEGTIIDTAGTAGRVRLYINDSGNRGTYENAVALANSRPTEKVFRIQQASGDVDYSEKAAVPANAFFNVTGTATNVTLLVDDEAGLTREGTADAKTTGITLKLANDLTLTADVDVGAANVDYQNHRVTGGRIITTGTVTNKPAASSNVGTAGELNDALAELNAITLTADINYGDVLTIPEGTTIDLAGHKLTVRNTTLASFGAGAITDTVGTGLVAIKLSSTEATAKVEYLDAVEAAYQQGRNDNPNFLIARIELSSNLDMSGVAKSTTGGTETAAEAKARWTYAGTKYNGYLSGSNLWLWAGVPNGVTVDLRGYTLTARAFNTGFGSVEDTSAGQNGKLVIMAWNGVKTTVPRSATIMAEATNNAPHKQITYTNAISGSDANYQKIITIPEGVVVVVNKDDDTSFTITLDEGGGYVFESGATLQPQTTNGFAITAPEGIVFEVANEADLTRAGIEYATKIKLVADITLDGNVDVGAKDVDYGLHAVTGGEIVTTGAATNKIPENNPISVGTKDAFIEGLTTATKMTLTANINYNDVLTIPGYLEIDLNGHKLYVTGLINNGTLTKNGGTLWANVSANTAITAAVSAADVSNFWAAQEELLDPNTAFDGIRLAALLGSANPAGTTANVTNYLPKLKATGAYHTQGGNEYFVAQIPAGKTLDLNGKAIHFYATANNIGLGTVVDTAGNDGRIRLMYNDANDRGAYANALAIAATRPDQKIFRFQQAGTLDYSELAPIPANAYLIVIGDAATNVTLLVDDEAGLTREGTVASDTTKITGITLKLTQDLTLNGNVDVGAANVDYQNHTVTGGKIITTGTVTNKPAVSPNVGTAGDLNDALAELDAITLTADIDYNAVLTIPTGVTVDLNGHNLYVTGLVNNGTLTKNSGKLWANVSASTALEETPTAADVSNIWAANEELLDENTEFDGIRLTANLAYGAAATPGSAKATILPNLYGATAFVNNNSLGHAVVKIPAGKILDLNGHTFNMPAARNTLGSGTIEANGGKITAYFYGIDNSVPNFAIAVNLAKNHPGVVTRLWHNANELEYTDAYVIPSGTTFAKNSSAKIKGTLVFGVANEADFTRDGVDVAVEEGAVKQFKLLNSITLTQDIDVGAANVDYAYNNVTGGKITTTGEELQKVTPNVGDKAMLDKALEAGFTAITLTADIDYDGALTIPTGTTIDLAGKNLYVTGLVNNGTLTKNGGKLWARVNTTAALTAAPTAESGLNNLWAANEELLRSGTEFDGIWLAGNISTGANNPYGTGTNDEVIAWLETNLPNLWAADALSMKFNNGESYVKYGIISIPDGKTLDLNGKTLTLRATRPTLGEGEIVANDGSITLWYNGTTSSVGGQTLKNADDIAAERTGIVKAYNQTGSAVQYNNYPIPSGVTLTLAGTSTVTEGHTVTFLVANEADFTRTGTDSEKITAKTFKLANDLTLTQNIDVGDANVDYNHHEVTGGEIITTGEVTNKVVAVTETPATEAELEAALKAGLPTVTLAADIDCEGAVTVPAGTTLALGNYNLAVVGLTNNGTITKGTGKLTWKVSYPNAWVASYTNDQLLQDNSFLKALNAMNEASSPIDTIKFTTNIWATVSTMPDAISAAIFPNLTNDGSRYILNIPEGKTVEMNGKNLYVNANSDTFGAGTLQDTAGGSVVRTYCSSSTALANSIPLATAYPTATFEMMTNASWSASTFDVPAAANVNFKMNSGNACTFRSASVYAGRTLDISGGNGGTLDAQYLKMGSGATFKLTKDKVTLPEVILFEVSPSTLAADIANAEAQIAYLEAQGVLNFSNIQFKLTLDHNYAQNIDLSAYDYDFEFGGSYINGNYTVTVKSGRTVTKEFGGGYATTVTSRSDFISAVGNNKWDKIIVNGTFTVYQNVNAAAKVIEIVSGKTLTMSGSYVLTCRDIIGDGTFVGRVGKSQTVSSAAELVTYLREASANTANTYMLTLTNDIDARRATWSGGAAIENSTNTGIVMTIPSNVELDLNGYNLTVRHLNGTGFVANGTVTYGVWNTMSLDRALDALTTSSYKSLIKTIIVMDSFDYGKALTIPSGVTVRFENNYRVITKGVTNNGTVDKGEYPYAMFALGVASEAEINAGNANLQGCDEMALTADASYNGTLTLANKLDLNGKTLTVADIAAGSGEKLLNYRRATTVGAPGKLRLGVTTAEALAGAATATFTAGSETVQSIWINSSTGSNLNKVTVTDYTVNELADAEKIAIIADLTLDRDITINRNVKLEADAEGTGYVLNLNGHVLNIGTGTFSTSFGYVIDTATADPDNTLEDFGLLKAGIYKMVNTERNVEPTAADVKQAYQPMFDYDHGYGYRFFKISTNLRTSPKVADGKLTFKFMFDFANKAAWDVFVRKASNMQYYVGLESAPSESVDSKTILFVFREDVLQDYASRQKNQTDGQQNVLTMSFSSFESLRGRYVWTDPYLGMRGADIAYENRGDLKFKPVLIDGENTTFDGTTIGEMIEAGDLSPAQDALLATAFAYYNMNPMTQYGMNYYGHAGEIRTDADGNIINTEPGIGNMLTNVFFNTRSTRGWRRTTRISPESVAEDNFYYSQCSEFPYNVYYNTILNEDGTPYEYYGGPSALFDSWYRDGVRGLVPVDGNGNVLDRSDYNFSAKLSYYRMPKQLEINADKNNGRANEYGYVVTGFNSGWSSYPTVLPQSKVGGSVEEALDNVSALAQPGDIFYVPSHVLLCIGDYDNDGYMEFMHCWPVVSTDDTEDFTANGNFASELTYRFKAVGTSYSEVNSATHYLDGDKMVAFAANAGYSTKYAKRGSLYKLTNTYEPGEKHEQSGALEIVELKNNKLTVDTPISGSTSTSTQRFNMAAQDYFFVFRPLMSTKHADELATGYNQSLSCVNATISPAASARRAYGTKMAEGVQLEKYVYSGDRLHTWDTLLAGETYTLEETIVNTTASAITFNEIREGLPKGTTFISASAGGTQLSGGSRNVLWSDVTVAANGSTTVSITFKVDDSVATGTVLDFPSGYVGQMESRHFGIKVGANAVSNADVNALSALANSSNVTATIKGSDASVATDLAFVKQVYKNVVGKELDIPDTAAAYIESGFENSDGAKGYDFESAYFRTKMYKSVLVDVVTKNTEVQRNTQAGNMAEMLINKHIGGKLVSLCIDDNGNFSPFKVTDDNLQENYTMYELLYENRYQVGDFLMTIQACHSVDRFDRFYTGNGLSVNDPYTMNTDTQYVTVSIYLGNGKVLELSGNGTPEVKNFTESEFNTAVGEAFFGVFRPRQSESYGG